MGTDRRIRCRLVDALTSASIARVRIGGVSRVRDAIAQAAGGGSPALLKARVIAPECIGSAACEADWICLGACRRCHAKNARRSKKWCKGDKQSSHFVSPFVGCRAHDDVSNVGVCTSAIQLIVCIFPIDRIDRSDGLGEWPCWVGSEHDAAL